MFVFLLISEQLVDTVFLCCHNHPQVTHWQLTDKLCFIAPLHTSTVMWLGVEGSGLFLTCPIKWEACCERKTSFYFQRPTQLLSSCQSWLNMFRVQLGREATPDLWADFGLPLEDEEGWGVLEAKWPILNISHKKAFTFPCELLLEG